MLNDILKNRFTCREWDRTKDVPFELIQGILQDIYDAPRKFGDIITTVKVLSPSPEGERLKNELLKLSWCRGGEKGAKNRSGHIRLQGQLTAPYVFLFGADFKLKYDPGNVANTTIQTTLAMISAHEKGLNTGYCQCIEPDELMNSDLNFCAISMLGVGYGAPTVDTPELYEVNRGVEIVPGELHAEQKNVTPGKPYYDERKKPAIEDMSVII